MDKYIANYISKLNNCYKCRQHYFDVRYTKNTKNLTLFLLKKGFIQGFEADTKVMRVFLKSMELKKISHYTPNTNNVYSLIQRPFRSIDLVSKGSINVYTSYKKLNNFYIKLPFMYVLSTKKGLLTATEALKLKVGGKICFKIIL